MRSSYSRSFVYVALPIAVVMASGMIARAFDTSWIAPGQPVSSSQLKADLDEVQSRLATVEAAAVPDCPPGYAVAAKPYIANNPLSVQCTNGTDVVDKVGVGRSAFWIDQYETSLWTTPSGGTQITGALPAGFPANGQWTTPVYALSVTGVQPQIGMSWYQANEACRLSGKRLATGDEWLTAASGTTDPGDNASAPACNTSGDANRNTGLGAGGCASRWGAEDMIGNAWEWTRDWFASPGTATAIVSSGPAPTGFNGDGQGNVGSTAAVSNNGSTVQSGMPAAAIRGGSNNNGTLAGVFAFDLSLSPGIIAFPGMRCLIP